MTSDPAARGAQPGSVDRGRLAASAATTVLLVGNPNAGKSTLFARMTGIRARIVNVPGTTVEMHRGTWRLPPAYAAPAGSDTPRTVQVVDLPGTYSLVTHSPEETVVIDALNDRSATVVVVVDAAALARSLYLLAQIAQTGRPVVVAMTMLDVAAEHGHAVRPEDLAEALGVPVVGIDPRTGSGLAELADALRRPALVRGIALTEEIATDALLLTDRLTTAQGLFDWVEALISQLQPPLHPRITRTDRVDRVLLNPWVGFPSFVVVLWALFELTTSIAGPLIDLVQQWVSGPVSAAVGQVLAQWAPSWVAGLLVDGVLVGLGIVAAFVPVMAITYLGLAIIEDSGYLARVAYLADHAMRVVGLDGRAILPLVLGYGCNVPALAATRTLPGHRQRLFTAFLVPWTSCAARLAVYVVLAEIVAPDYAAFVVLAMYLTSVAMVLAGGAVLKVSVFRSMRAEPLVLVLPPYQRPRLRGLMASVGARVWSFVVGAGAVVVGALVVVWVLLSIPAPGGASAASGSGPSSSLYGWSAQAVAPVFAPAGFGDWHITSALAGGFVAKEVVVGQLAQSYAMDQTDSEGLVAAVGQTLEHSSGGHRQAAGLALMVFVLGYTPCVATVAEQRRILGSRWTAAAVVTQIAVAWALATVVFQVGRVLV